MRELANRLERLAILFPERIVTAADLPERYRSAGACGCCASGVHIVKPLPAADPEPVAAPVSMVDERIVLKGEGIDLKDHLSAIEIGLIRQALVEADGTVAEAARLLKIRRTTLVEKLRKYRLSA